MIARLRQVWPALTLFASLSLLAGAHAFESFGGLAPCRLCLEQRQWHWGVVAVSAAALALLWLRPGLARWAAALVGLALLGAAAKAGYHVAVEQHWIVAQCETTALGDIGTIDFNTRYQAPRCDQVAWQMFGISMAGYNFLISLALALASFAVAATPRTQP